MIRPRSWIISQNQFAANEFIVRYFWGFGAKMLQCSNAPDCSNASMLQLENEIGRGLGLFGNDTMPRDANASILDLASLPRKLRHSKISLPVANYNKWNLLCVAWFLSAGCNLSSINIYLRIWLWPVPFLQGSLNSWVIATRPRFIIIISEAADGKQAGQRWHIIMPFFKSKVSYSISIVQRFKQDASFFFSY